MTVELRPLGVLCNIQCQYCYQNPQRDAGNLSAAYDMQKMKDAIKQEGGPFSLFGGEALMVPLHDLEELWAWGVEQYGGNSIQTNGTLITDEHITLFKKYKVHVGISLDGPSELNDARWAGSLEKTRSSTAAAEESIRRLCSEHIPPSLIVTLHRGNAAAERLPVLYDWMRYLHSIGVRSVRLHLLEVENKEIGSKYALSAKENIQALLGFLALETDLATMRFDLFADMRNMLAGNDKNATCVWTGCDSYTTRAVRGVEGHGQRSNCGRTNKDGIDFVKSEASGFERYLALYHTPQSAGGCQGCRFFLMCKGNCPGTAMGGDWRNRTEHCEVWKTLYGVLEKELQAAGRKPISLSEHRIALERAFLQVWTQGRNTTMAQLLAGSRERNPQSTAAPAGAAARALTQAQSKLSELGQHDFFAGIG